MDFVDQALSDLRQESCVFCHILATEPWHIEKSQSPVAPFYVVLSGCVHIALEGTTQQLSTGDFMVLPTGAPHRVLGCHSEGTEAIPLLTLFQQKGISAWTPGTRLRAIRFEYGGGGEAAEILIGLFYFGDPQGHPLLSVLPPSLVLHTSQDNDGSQCGNTMSAIGRELNVGQTGWSFAVARHADLLFIQALRAYLASLPEPARGWVRGMNDRVISRALIAIHQAPEKRWSLQSLAKHAGSSRATFAQHFTQVMGVGAIAYLASWRMHIGARLLREGDSSLAEIAGRVGYSTDGFSTAFKHWAGISPREYRLKQTALNLPHDKAVCLPTEISQPEETR